MSINDFIDKIKGQMVIDNTTLLCLFAVLLVGVSSFGLGRLSAIQNANQEESIVKNNEINTLKNEGDNVPLLKGGEIENSSSLDKKRMYIASKNGKLYYTPNCQGAKRILPKNEVWFANSTEATQAGYTLSASCK